MHENAEVYELANSGTTAEFQALVGHISALNGGAPISEVPAGRALSAVNFAVIATGGIAPDSGP